MRGGRTRAAGSGLGRWRGRIILVSALALAGCGGTVAPVAEPEAEVSSEALPAGPSPTPTGLPLAQITDEQAVTGQWGELSDTRWARIIEPPKARHRFFALPNQRGQVRVWVDCLSPGPSSYQILMRGTGKVRTTKGECGAAPGYDPDGGFSLEAQAPSGGVVEVEVTGDLGAVIGGGPGRERFAILVSSGGQPQDAVGRRR